MKHQIPSASTAKYNYYYLNTQEIDKTNYQMFPGRNGALNRLDFYITWGENSKNAIISEENIDYEICTHEYNYKNNSIISISAGAQQKSAVIDPSIFEGTLKLIALIGIFRNGGFSGSGSVRLFEAKITQGTAVIHDLVPVLDANGTPCMFDKISKQRFYNSGTGSFIVGMTMRQLPALLHLPTVTSGELKLSLPWEAQLIKYGAPAILEEVKNKGWTLIVQYAEPDTESAVYNKYAECKNESDLRAVNPEFYLDTTSDGEWVYPLPNVTTLKGTWNKPVFANLATLETNIKVFRIPLPEIVELEQAFFNNKKLQHCEIIAPKCSRIIQPLRWAGTATLTYFSCYAPCATTVNELLTYNEVLEEVELETPMVTYAQRYFYKDYGLKRIKCSEDMFHNVTNAAEMYLDCYVLELFPVEYPALSIAYGMFSNCKITGQQAIAVLNSIPAYTSGSHTITMGIHVDYQNDPDVIAAITNAEAKGWTLTVQWNGTATAAAASTYGLRRPPVYAKLAEPREEEEQMLDWGHYVTNWEEHGYTEFASLEEAYAHFNLTMPE